MPFGLMNKSVWTDLINCVSTFVSDHNRDSSLTPDPCCILLLKRTLSQSYSYFKYPSLFNIVKSSSTKTVFQAFTLDQSLN